MKNKDYCYLKEGFYVDYSIGEIDCMKLYRTQDKKKLGFFFNFNDAETAARLLNELYKELK